MEDVNIYKLLITVCISAVVYGCSTQKNFSSLKSKNIETRCGGFTAQPQAVKYLKDSVVIYGEVFSCPNQVRMSGAIVKVYKKDSKILAFVTTDKKGYYKLKLPAGTYSLNARQISYGFIETGLIEFNPNDSTRANLYLSIGEDLKN